MAKRTMSESLFSMTLIRHEHRAMYAAIGGDFDIAAVPDFEATLREGIDAGARQIAIDLNGATSVDSTALTSLLRLHRLLKDQAGAFYVVCVNPRIVNLFAITGLVRVLSVVAVNPLENTPLAS